MSKYVIVENGITKSLTEYEPNIPPGISATAYEITEEEYQKLLNFESYYYDPSSETIQSVVYNSSQLVSFFGNSIFTFMEQTAISYNYKSLEDVVTFSNSGITAWRNEAIAFNTWRDNTLSLMYKNIHSFTADGITLPSLTGGSFTAQSEYVPLGITSPSRPLIL